MEYGYEYFGLKMEQGEGISCELPSQTGSRDQFTLMLWFYVSDSNTIKGLVSQEDGIELGIAYDALYISCQGKKEVTKPILLKNIWNHVAIVLFESAVEVFFNGASVLLKSFSDPRLTGKPLTIGRDFFGYLRSVTLYQNALITDEIQYLMYQTAAEKPMLIDCDFTSNPPVDHISGKTLRIPERARIVCLSPSAAFDNSAYFRCVEGTIQPWLDPRGNFTIQTWLNFSPNTEQDYSVVISNLDELLGGGMELGIIRGESGYRLRVYFGTPDTPAIESASTLQMGVWQNIAFVCSDKLLKLYIDGALDTEQTVESFSKPLGNDRLLLGARNSFMGENGSLWYRGYIARVDIWKTALTQTQISTYAEEPPDATAVGLLASWDLFDANVINAISGIPLGRVNSASISLREQAAKTNTQEVRRVPLTQAADISLLPPEVIQKARMESGIMEYMKTDDFHSKAILVTSCPYQDRLYFLCHDVRESYPVASVQADTDAVVVWCIELVLIIISGIIGYFLSMKITYSEALAQYIRQHILTTSASRMVIAAIADSGSISTVTLMTLLKEIICSGKLTAILRIACNCGFWLVVSFVLGFARRFLAAGADIAIWIGALISQIGLHIKRFPKDKAFRIQLESVLFCHDEPGKICSIHVRRNLEEEWSLPEWVGGRDDEKNAPAVYRLARFSKNQDVLEIKATFLSVNTTNSPITYEIRAVGSDPFGTSGTQIIKCPPGNKTHTVYFKFNDAKARFEEKGIEQYDLTLSWELREADAKADVLDFIQFHLSKHRIYSILDSVNAPWGASRTYHEVDGHQVWVDEPWTELYEKTIDIVRNTFTPGTAMRQIEAAIYNNRKYIYDSNSAFGLCRSIDDVGFQKFLQSASSDAPFRINCQDCSILMIATANLYGCNLKYMVQGQEFKLAAQIKLIGETQERDPDSSGHGKGWFTYHYFSVEGNLAGSDATQLYCYDPCLMYHSRSDQTLRLAGGVQLSVSEKPEPQQTLPQIESYLECVMENSLDGLGKYSANNTCGPLYFISVYPH